VAAASYRRMYLLAIEIAGSELASRDVRKAARRVIRILEDVVELPIADARLLARARQRFSDLVATLSRNAGLRSLNREQKSPGHEDRAMELH
jgi:hypothetical protein